MIPWRRDRLPTPVFWPGEFHGLYSPWGHKESDTTEQLPLPLSLLLHIQNTMAFDSKYIASSSHLLNKYLVNIYWAGSNIIGAEDIAINTEGFFLKIIFIRV